MGSISGERNNDLECPLSDFGLAEFKLYLRCILNSSSYIVFDVNETYGATQTRERMLTHDECGFFFFLLVLFSFVLLQ